MLLEGKALAGGQASASVHQLGFADLMVALELLGESPGEVVVFGVQPESTEWSAELTQAVAKALPALADSVIAQLKCWDEKRAAAIALKERYETGTRQNHRGV